MCGGYFSKPAEKHPNLFPPGSLLDKYPYLLPCLISACVNFVLLVLAWIYPNVMIMVMVMVSGKDRRSGADDCSAFL